MLCEHIFSLSLHLVTKLMSNIFPKMEHDPGLDVNKVVKKEDTAIGLMKEER